MKPPTSQDKPREFWIDNECTGDSCNADKPWCHVYTTEEPIGSIHVIEYSAYEHVAKELDRWINDYPFNIHKLDSQNKALEQKVRYLELELHVYKTQGILISAHKEIVKELIEALKLTATPSNIIHTVYPKCYCPRCKQKEKVQSYEEAKEQK